jgi:hypothetical protein
MLEHRNGPKSLTAQLITLSEEIEGKGLARQIKMIFEAVHPEVRWASIDSGTDAPA